MIAGLYSLAFLPGRPRLPSAAGGLLVIYPLGALLGAAQLLPGLAATGEAVRSGGVAYEFSAMFSVPPENFLTLFAPWVMGDMTSVPYWGRCYLWEMCFFVGTGGLLLASFGLAKRSEKHDSLRLAVVLVVSGLLALGAHTPIHHLLYDVLPGFSSFRGSSKFLFFAGLLLALFAGMGLDRLLRGERFPLALGIGGAVLGLILLVASFGITPTMVHDLARAAVDTHESYLSPAAFDDPEILRAATTLGARSLGFAGGLLLVYVGLLTASRRWTWLRAVAGIAVVIELLVFAKSTVVSFPLEDFTYRPMAEFLEKNPGDYRILNLVNPDSAMLVRVPNIWGYDPSVLKRYARLLFVSQGLDPDTAGQYLNFRGNHPILTLLRGQFVLAPQTNGEVGITKLQEPFQRFSLYSSYRVRSGEAAVLADLRDPQVDLRSVVLLEKEPDPKPDAGTVNGKVRVVDSSTDHWTLEIETDRAAILLMTDSYSKDWRVEALPGSVQNTCQLMPANGALRAIPLEAGKHRLRLVYSPTAFSLGVAFTIMSTLLIAAFLLMSTVRTRFLLKRPVGSVVPGPETRK